MAKARAEALAEQFHETYERLAPGYDYETRPESAVAWEDVPENNRNLMVAVCAEILRSGTLGEARALPPDPKPTVPDGERCEFVGGAHPHDWRCQLRKGHWGAHLSL